MTVGEKTNYLKLGYLSTLGRHSSVQVITGRALVEPHLSSQWRFPLTQVHGILLPTQFL